VCVSVYWVERVVEMVEGVDKIEGVEKIMKPCFKNRANFVKSPANLSHRRHDLT
jgi:hypothetical protein